MGGRNSHIVLNKYSTAVAIAIVKTPSILQLSSVNENMQPKSSCCVADHLACPCTVHDSCVQTWELSVTLQSTSDKERHDASTEFIMRRLEAESLM